MKIIIAVLAGALSAAVPLGAQAPPAKTTQAPSASAKDKSAGQGTNTNAAVLADFSKRVNAYDALRKGAEKGEARLEQHRDPAKIDAERNALVMKIRTARAGAKPGDIFTVESRPVFRSVYSARSSRAPTARRTRPQSRTTIPAR